MWRKLSHSIPVAQLSQIPPQSSTLKSSSLSHRSPAGAFVQPSRGSWTLSVKTQWEALYRPDVGQDACAVEPPPPTAEGWRHTHASLQGYVGTFNKAERKLNNYYWLGIKLTFTKHLGAEYWAKYLMLLISLCLSGVLRGSWHQAPLPLFWRL